MINYFLLHPSEQRSHLDLMRKSFGKPQLSLNWYRWYLKNPMGAPITMVARDGPRLAAAYTMLPIRVRLSGKSRQALLACNICVDPDYRGHGLFIDLSLVALRHAQSEDYELILGMPNAQAIRGHLKVGWQEVMPLSKLELSIPRAVPVSSTHDGHDSPIIPVSFFDHCFTRCHIRREDIGDSALIIEKDASRMNWRLEPRHGEIYHRYVIRELCGKETGYVIFKTYHERVHILDIYADGPAGLIDLLRQVEVHGGLFQEATTMIDLWSSPWMPQKQIFLDHGFREVETPSDRLIAYPLDPAVHPILKKLQRGEFGSISFCYLDNDVF